MDYYISVFKNGLDFKGRARRSEYWYFGLFNFIVYIVLAVIDGATGTMMEGGYGLLTLIYLLISIIPSIAVTIRRLHDTGRCGWWILISIIPILGGIIFLVFMCLDSHAGDNEYGANPKANVDTSVVV